MEKTEVTMKELIKVIKFAPFISNYTELNPSGGIQHRINGYGTTNKSKPKELTNNDKIQIKQGLEKLVTDIQSVLLTLNVEEDDQIQS